MRGKKRTSGRKQTTAIDWNKVHSHLEMAQAAIERGFERTLEEKKRVLKARARALAHEPVAGEEGKEVIEVVEFLLAYEKYAIESSFVREAYPLKEFTPLPCTPPFVLGIINVRGQVLSVLDLKKFFDLPEKGLTDLNKVIIVRNGNMDVAILADAILGVREIPLKDVQAPLPTLTGLRAEYIRGVTRERLVVLDVEKILSDKRIVVHEEVQT